jgi:hypothetical protein
MMPMTPPLRAATLALCAALWLSGVAWLVLHYGFAQATPYGPLPHPWEPQLLRVHGVLAVGAVFLFGWLTAVHLSARWSAARNRVSGLMLAGTATLLVVSGYALYYGTGMAHTAAAWTHRVLGVGALLAALPHWWRKRPAWLLRLAAPRRS